MRERNTHQYKLARLVLIAVAMHEVLNNPKPEVTSSLKIEEESLLHIVSQNRAYSH